MPTYIGTPRAKKNRDLILGKLTPAQERELAEWGRRPCRWCDQPEGAAQRCHKCPKFNGEIMPHCYGTIHGQPLDCCCCPPCRPPSSKLYAEVLELRRTVHALTRLVEQLTEDAKKR